MYNGKKVLIVEREEAAAEALAEMLRQLHLEPIILQPQETLALVFIEQEPAVVIIYRKLFLKNRQLFWEGNIRLSNARLIITSGAYLHSERIRELHVDGFLQTPFAIADLQRVLLR